MLYMHAVTVVLMFLVHTAVYRLGFIINDNVPQSLAIHACFLLLILLLIMFLFFLMMTVFFLLLLVLFLFLFLVSIVACRLRFMINDNDPPSFSVALHACIACSNPR